MKKVSKILLAAMLASAVGLAAENFLANTSFTIEGSRIVVASQEAVLKPGKA